VGGGTDGAPSMLGTKSGFQACVKKRCNSERHSVYTSLSGTGLKNTSTSSREGFGLNNLSCEFCQRRSSQLMTFQVAMC